jgi:hypothetical protein
MEAVALWAARHSRDRVRQLYIELTLSLKPAVIKLLLNSKLTNSFCARLTEYKS